MSSKILSEAAIVPSQIEWQPRAAEGTRRLMVAVLEDAIGRYLSRDQLGDEAFGWIFSDDRSHPFSFLNVCDAVDLDPSSVRSVLGKLRAAKRQRRPSVVRRHAEAGRELSL